MRSRYAISRHPAHLHAEAAVCSRRRAFLGGAWSLMPLSVLPAQAAHNTANVLAVGWPHMAHEAVSGTDSRGGSLCLRRRFMALVSIGTAFHGSVALAVAAGRVFRLACFSSASSWSTVLPVHG